ncbi:MAG: DUF3352 domain-containing protein, partial [Acidobacteriaceae bacterium]|nr:DUF3352 domain-containing protein [Acidobacteriaceae bacterium]
EADNPNVLTDVQELQAASGVNLVQDIGNTLGGELTVALDGPLVPVPSWKLAVEVYQPDRLEWSIEQLVAAYNRQPQKGVTVALNKSTANGLTYYQLLATGGSAPSNAEADYVFIDGYLLAAANRSLLDSAIQNRATGNSLARSQNFRNLLPQDANSNFSAIVYHNVSGLVGSLADGLQAVNAATPEQKAAINSLRANSAPGLIYAYGEPDKITISANGGLFGFNLDSLALPKVIESMTRHKPK